MRNLLPPQLQMAHNWFQFFHECFHRRALAVLVWIVSNIYSNFQNKSWYLASVQTQKKSTKKRNSFVKTFQLNFNEGQSQMQKFGYSTDQKWIVQQTCSISSSDGAKFLKKKPSEFASLWKKTGFFQIYTLIKISIFFSSIKQLNIFVKKRCYNM